MALDTTAKRSSAIYVSQPWRGRMAFPDGMIAQGDRQAIAFMYSGISAGGVSTIIRNMTLLASKTTKPLSSSKVTHAVNSEIDQ